MKSRKLQALDRTVKKLSKLSDSDFFERIGAKQTTPFTSTLVVLFGGDVTRGIEQFEKNSTSLKMFTDERI